MVQARRSVRYFCTVLFALFLSLSKRRHELTSLSGAAAGHRAILAEYSPYLLDQMIGVVTASCLMAYAFYTTAEETRQKFQTDRLAWTIPFVLYGIFRYLYLVHQKEKGGSPTDVLLTDRPLLLDVALWAAAVIFIAAFLIKLSWTIHGVWEPFPGLFLKQLWPINKNNLSPLRLVPFYALVVLVATLVPRDARFLEAAAARPLVLCGQQSLEIFCLGIILSALAHFILTEYGASVTMQLAVNAAGIAVMFLTAQVIAWYKTVDRTPVLLPAAASRQSSDGVAE